MRFALLLVAALMLVPATALAVGAREVTIGATSPMVPRFDESSASPEAGLPADLPAVAALLAEAGWDDLALTSALRPWL